MCVALSLRPKFISSSDVKHQKCQKELEIIYVSKKLTEEGLGSTTSLTKTQQREVRKKMKKWSQANQRSEKYWSGWHIKETRKSEETGPEKGVDI